MKNVSLLPAQSCCSQVPPGKYKPKYLQRHLGHFATFCSCRFSLVKSLLLLILGVFLFHFFVFEQSSKMCMQHSPLQECGGVLHDDCNARLALMFARCAVCLRPCRNHRTGCPPPVTAGITPGKEPVFCLHSLRRTMVRQPAGDAETHLLFLLSL